MPVYTYVCEACGLEQDVVRDASRKNQSLECEHLTSVFPGDNLLKRYPMYLRETPQSDEENAPSGVS